MNAFFDQKLTPLMPVETFLRVDEILAKLKPGHHSPALQALLSQPSSHRAFLESVCQLSVFLRDSFMAYPEILDNLLSQDIDHFFDDLLAKIAALASANANSAEEMSESAFMKELRILKRKAHVLIALGFLARHYDYYSTAENMSRLAQYCLKAALCFLLRQFHYKGALKLIDLNQPEQDCGLIILAMGKLGAGELNFSSDIDLIAFIDQEAPAILDQYDCVSVFSKLMRKLVYVLQERTSEGYVFRVDLRLRPDPGSNPLAIPVAAALRYYEARGQNWERAAMIKARPIAGDVAAGQKFCQEIFPYIWRKYLDYAAIADIHSIKRQIHVHKGFASVKIEGHNVKLGRGGIREIEFFVQTQQLIAGGRFGALRLAKTIDGLNALQQLQWICENTRDSLVKDYVFLRNLENAIQMVADEQSHIIGRTKAEIDALGYMMGYQDIALFRQHVLAVMQDVEMHYGALFEKEHELSTDLGNLVFTGQQSDPETLDTLAKLGYQRPDDICRIIRSWHFGRYRATRSVEARERLTDLTPVLLKKFADTKKADDTMVRFDRFIAQLPGGIQLFSLLNSNPSLLDIVTQIMSAAPRLADIITLNPHIFDGLLDPALYENASPKHYWQKRLDDMLSDGDDYEGQLENLRVFASEARFLIGIQFLLGQIDGITLGKILTQLADDILKKALWLVEGEFAQIYGKLPAGSVAILGMGKLASHELSAGSDVDIILIYDYDEEQSYSDGAKSLHVGQYYERLTKRLVTALSAPMTKGIIFDVDLRLRPSGNKGPLAVYINSFDKYQRHEAWGWEHLALTRCRVIAGDKALKQRLACLIGDIITSGVEADKMPSQIKEMRMLIAKEKPPRNLYDLKAGQGGLIDIEFIAQFAIIIKAVAPIAGQTTGEVIKKLPEWFMGAEDKNTLYNAYIVYTDISQLLRLCLEEVADIKDFPLGLNEAIMRITHQPDLARVETLLQEIRQQVDQIFSNMFKP